MTNDVEHVFISVLSICISSFEKCLLKSCAIFFKYWIFLSSYWIGWVLYINRKIISHNTSSSKESLDLGPQSSSTSLHAALPDQENPLWPSQTFTVQACKNIDTNCIFSNGSHNNKGPHPQCHTGFPSLLQTLRKAHQLNLNTPTLVEQRWMMTRVPVSNSHKVWLHPPPQLLPAYLDTRVWPLVPFKDTETSAQAPFIFLLKAPEVKV